MQRVGEHLVNIAKKIVPPAQKYRPSRTNGRYAKIYNPLNKKS